MGNWDRDIKTGEGWWSEETYRIFGLEPAVTSPTLETFLGCIHPEDRDRVKDAIDRCLEGREPYSVEYRITRPDGTLRTVYGRGTWRVDRTGKPARISGTVQDITQRKRAEQRLLDAIETISDGFAFYDSDERLVLANSRYVTNEKMCPAIFPGARFETFIRHDVELGLIPASKGREEEWIAERLEHFRDPTGILEQRQSDGRWMQISERKTDDGGTVVIFTDITERKKAVDELAEKSLALETTLENMGQGITMIDADLKVLAFNQKFLELLEFPADVFKKGFPWSRPSALTPNAANTAPATSRPRSGKGSNWQNASNPMSSNASAPTDRSSKFAAPPWPGAVSSPPTRTSPNASRLRKPFARRFSGPKRRVRPSPCFSPT